MRLVCTHQRSVVQVLLRDRNVMHRILRVFQVAVVTICSCVRDSIFYSIKTVLMFLCQDKFLCHFQQWAEGMTNLSKIGNQFPDVKNRPQKRTEFP